MEGWFLGHIEVGGLATEVGGITQVCSWCIHPHCERVQ